MKNDSDKILEQLKTQSFCSITSPKMWKKYGRFRQAKNYDIIQRMHFECWITKGTHTHLENVILNAFPRQQCLRERVSVLIYTSFTRLVLQ